MKSASGARVVVAGDCWPRACACQSEKSHGEKREQERSSKPAQPSSDHSIFFVSVYFSKTKEPAAPIGRPTQSPEPPTGKVRFQPETTTTLAWSKISHKAPQARTSTDHRDKYCMIAYTPRHCVANIGSDEQNQNQNQNQNQRKQRRQQQYQ